MEKQLLGHNQFDSLYEKEYGKTDDQEESKEIVNEEIEYDENNQPFLKKRKREEKKEEKITTIEPVQKSQKVSTKQLTATSEKTEKEEVVKKTEENKKEIEKETKEEEETKKLVGSLFEVVDANQDELDDDDVDFKDDELEDDEFDDLIKSSKKIEKEREDIQKDAELEMMETVKLDPVDFQIFKEMKEKEEVGEEYSSAEIHSRIVRIVQILLNFKDLREEGYNRKDYLDRLKIDLCKYYTYSPELLGRFFQFFSIPEIIEFLDASEQPRPVTIRINSLKVSKKQLGQMLISRGVEVSLVEGKWAKNAIKILKTGVPLGATPEYLAGYYVLQNPASLLPVIALDPKMGESVLDMSASPGIKCTYISERMKNSGIVYANDVNREREKALVSNIHRMGVKNTIAINYDGRDLPKVTKNMDKVLLDAPCTGIGVISKDPSIKTGRTELEIAKAINLQKELILAGIDCLKVGGIMVYSTCSILPDENEAVIDYALRKRYIKIEQTGIPFGKKGFTKVHSKRFNDSIQKARRFYPHVHNIDGFFVCKIRKIENGARGVSKKSQKKREKYFQRKKRKMKEQNISAQKEREEYNKKVFMKLLRECGGNEGLAKQKMKERKDKIINERKKFKKPQKKKKWRKVVIGK